MGYKIRNKSIFWTRAGWKLAFLTFLILILIYIFTLHPPPQKSKEITGILRTSMLLDLHMVNSLWLFDAEMIITLSLEVINLLSYYPLHLLISLNKLGRRVNLQKYV